ncbi:MAG: hypothetical protein EOS75_31440 [Mesorhizobium sp.]|nr:MAG: hypothetical protein EOS75_31440 [Mesorhizobium sp.]
MQWLGGKVVAIVGQIMMGIGAMVLLNKAVTWLRFGEWNRVTVGAGLELIGVPPFHPQQSWIGLQKIIDWSISTFMGLPLDWSLLVVGLLAFVVGNFIALPVDDLDQEGSGN